jgi:hypothetical protein
MKKFLLSSIFIASTLLTFSQANNTIHDVDACIIANNYFNSNVTTTISVLNPDATDTDNPNVTKLEPTATNGTANFDLGTVIPVNQTVEFSIRIYSKNPGALNSGTGRFTVRIFNRVLGAGSGGGYLDVISVATGRPNGVVDGWQTYTTTVDTNNASDAVKNSPEAGYNAFYILPSNAGETLEPLYFDDFKTSAETTPIPTPTLDIDNYWLQYPDDASDGNNYTTRADNGLTYTEESNPDCSSSTSENVAKLVRGDMIEAGLFYTLKAPIDAAGTIKFKVLTEGYTFCQIILRPTLNSGTNQQSLTIPIPANTAGTWQDIEFNIAAPSTALATEYNGLIIRFDYNSPNGGPYPPGKITYFDALQVPISAKLSIEEQNAFNFKLYPNPVKNVLHIKSQEPLKNIKVYDIMGRKTLDINNPLESIDISSLNTGLYVLKLEANNGGLSVQRIIKN